MSEQARPISAIHVANDFGDCSCGADGATCQVCGDRACGTLVAWTVVPGRAHKGNVCKTCRTRGTRWTEPGKGASILELENAIPENLHTWAVSKWRRAMLGEGIGGSLATLQCRTNLALTGEPVTAEDVQRILVSR